MKHKTVWSLEQPDKPGQNFASEADARAAAKALGLKKVELTDDPPRRPTKPFFTKSVLEENLWAYTFERSAYRSYFQSDYGVPSSLDKKQGPSAKELKELEADERRREKEVRAKEARAKEEEQAPKEKKSLRTWRVLSEDGDDLAAGQRYTRSRAQDIAKKLRDKGIEAKAVNLVKPLEKRIRKSTPSKKKAKPEVRYRASSGSHGGARAGAGRKAREATQVFPVRVKVGAYHQLQAQAKSQGKKLSRFVQELLERKAKQ